MFHLRAFALAVAFLPILFTEGFADPPSAAVKKKIIDAYAKVDKLSISCFAYELSDDGERKHTALGNVAYRFDRATKQLAIGAEGVPWMLVNNGQLFLRAYRDEGGVGTYLEIDKPIAICSRDIDDAMRVIQKKCPLIPPDSVPCCFVLPFLDGGAEKLFGAPAELLSENDPKGSLIFGIGHPEGRITIGPLNAEQRKLDPKKTPLCTRTNHGSSTWEYAFDSDNGIMTAAHGFVPSDEVTGIPGRRIEYIMQRQWSFADGPSAESHEVAFELPQNAKRVKAEDLRAAYLAGLGDAGGGVEKLMELQRESQKPLKANSEKETELVTQIARQRAAATVDQVQLRKSELELEETRVEKTEISFVAKELQAAIDELQRGKNGAGARK